MCFTISILISAEGSERQGTGGGEEGYSPIQQESCISGKSCYQTREERKVRVFHLKGNKNILYRHGKFVYCYTCKCNICLTTSRSKGEKAQRLNLIGK